MKGRKAAVLVASEILSTQMALHGPTRGRSFAIREISDRIEKSSKALRGEKRQDMVSYLNEVKRYIEDSRLA